MLLLKTVKGSAKESKKIEDNNTLGQKNHSNSWNFGILSSKSAIQPYFYDQPKKSKMESQKALISGLRSIFES